MRFTVDVVSALAPTCRFLTCPAPTFPIHWSLVYLNLCFLLKVQIIGQWKNMLFHFNAM